MEIKLPPNIAYRGNLNIGSMVEPTKISKRILVEEQFRKSMDVITEAIIASARDASSHAVAQPTLYFAMPDEFMFGDVIQFYSNKSPEEIDETKRIEAEKAEIEKHERYRMFLALSAEFGQPVEPEPKPEPESPTSVTLAEAMSEYGISLQEIMG